MRAARGPYVCFKFGGFSQNGGTVLAKQVGKSYVARQNERGNREETSGGGECVQANISSLKFTV